MECDQRIRHGGHCYQREQPGADLANLVAEVEQSDGEPAEDDGEVEPGEKGALVGEEDLGLDAGGEGDALAWGLESVSWRVQSGKRVLPGAVWRRGCVDMTTLSCDPTVWE